jgi:Ser/Thr protein kinase RdoA (MazF antagonist)
MTAARPLPVPEQAADLTRGWLTAALGTPVAAVTATRIGAEQGFTGGALYRLTRPDGPPLVAKLAPADPARRAAFAPLNAREVAFYAAPDPALPVPRCAYGTADPSTGASVLLLEDLSAARAMPYLDGLAAPELVRTLTALATMHGRWWQSPALDALPPPAGLDHADFPALWARYPEAVARLMPGRSLSDRLRRLGDQLAAEPARLPGPGPHTLIHGDPQPDNLRFGADGAPILLDWQFHGAGPFGWDLAYLLISGMTPEARRRSEAAALRAYRTALARAGGPDLSPDALARAMRRGVPGKLFATVFATVSFAADTPHKLAYRRADLDRLTAFLDDHAVTPAPWETADVP